MTIQPPTDAELAAIADLAARATPGPWHTAWSPTARPCRAAAATLNQVC